MLADADDRNIAVLDTGFCSGFFVQGIDNKCIFGQIPHLTDPLFFTIHDKQLCAGACKFCRQRFPEAPKSDNTVCNGIFFFFPNIISSFLSGSLAYFSDKLCKDLRCVSGL